MPTEREELELLREMDAGVDERRELEILRALEAKPPAKNPLEFYGGKIKETATDVYDFLEGGGRREFDLPELGTSGPSVPPFSEEGKKMLGAYATAIDPQKIADIAVKTLPGSSAKADEFGNPIITFEGQDYYVNRPGVSEADFFQLLSQTGAYAPAARVAGAGKTLLNQMLRMGILSGATSAGLDVAAGAQGAEGGVDVPAAAIAAGSGALFQGLAPQVVKLWRKMFPKPQLFNTQTGKFTPAGRKEALKQGLDPDDMEMRLAGLEVEAGTDPAAAAGVATSREFKIPYTRGQTLQDYNQIAREEATRHGAYGEKPGDIMRQFDEEQREALTAARGQVQDRLSGGERVIAREAEGGAILGEGLKGRATQLGRQIDDAYTKARSKDARLTVESMTDMLKSTRERVRDFGLDADLHPSATRALRFLGKLSKDVKGGRISKLTLRRIETERRRLNALIGSAKNPPDKAATTRIKEELDRWLDDAIDNALFEGDPDALVLLKEARALRTEYGKKFQPRGRTDDTGKIMEKMIERDPTPEETVNYLFGRGKLGNKLISTRLAKRIKAVVGEESEEWSAVREMAWLRLSKAPEGVQSPKKFARAFDDAMENNRTLMTELFDADELSLMKRYRSALLRTVTPEGAMNPSKSAFTIARLIRGMIRRTGSAAVFGGDPTTGTALYALGRAPGIFGSRAARRATSPLPRRPMRAPGLVASGTAAYRSSRQEER